MHADWTLLPRGQLPERANIQLRANIELSPSSVKLLLDAPALFLMLLPVFVLTILVAIPNALARRALLDGITLLAARRTRQLGLGPVFRGGFGATVLPLRRFVE
jgi:hypothetical protein